ncbi:MAG TPA: YraN family protein [Bdellovibrionota bacterium]|nr:YraN family protein [Bdellovibrionota bacterium]
MDSRHELGKRAESEAAQWFSRQFQARLLARNYARRYGEIDLVFEIQSAEEAPELVFVEVRARTAGGWVNGVESVTPRKRARLSRTIAHFLAMYRGHARSARFDIMAWDGHAWTHLKNVWLD